MTAGRGIAHSERTGAEDAPRKAIANAHGLQTWLALPKTHEECAPEFAHHGGETLPRSRPTAPACGLIIGEA